MSLDPKIRASLTIPAICAPMFLVTGPALVREACAAGVIGGLPRQNARSLEEFEAWLAEITEALARRRDEQPVQRIAPIAVNLSNPCTAPDDPGGQHGPVRQIRGSRSSSASAAIRPSW